ncbi:MAG: rhodanese-like domain-containing protein [Verrucomicrobiota bacterium]
MSYPSILPNHLSQALSDPSQDLFLVDVRSPGEFRSGHIDGAINHAVDRFDVESARKLAGEAGDRRVVLICQSARRSKKALEVWSEAGLENAVELEGGMNAWPTNSSQGASCATGISLFRQVQIVAGSFVFVGTLLGAFVNPWYLLIPGFFGAGLTFAGVTGTCGMGVMLSKMPWNQ